MSASSAQEPIPSGWHPHSGPWHVEHPSPQPPRAGLGAMLNHGAGTFVTLRLSRCAMEAGTSHCPLLGPAGHKQEGGSSLSLRGEGHAEPSAPLGRFSEWGGGWGAEPSWVACRRERSESLAGAGEKLAQETHFPWEGWRTPAPG